jgi:hypothetical protein
MRRRLAVLATLSGLAIALSASPAMAGPVQHFTLPATQAGDNFGPMVIPCGARTYTLTSGDFLMVFRDPSVGAHLTARNVWASDQVGRAYRVLGTETYSPTRFTVDLMFVQPGGGIADSISVVARFNDAGMFVGLDLGTCSFT